mmetsp:Transcript_20026/g.76712  ORF Transcript_20026/g.76712 Transcript_20026/m.76712 type:complete len:270 (+) Transcript_20026:2424-3233(+)
MRRDREAVVRREVQSTPVAGVLLAEGQAVAVHHNRRGVPEARAAQLAREAGCVVVVAKLRLLGVLVEAEAAHAARVHLGHRSLRLGRRTLHADWPVVQLDVLLAGHVDWPGTGGAEEAGRVPVPAHRRVEVARALALLCCAFSLLLSGGRRVLVLLAEDHALAQHCAREVIHDTFAVRAGAAVLVVSLAIDVDRVAHQHPLAAGAAGEKVVGVAGGAREAVFLDDAVGLVLQLGGAVVALQALPVVVCVAHLHRGIVREDWPAAGGAES